MQSAARIRPSTAVGQPVRQYARECKPKPCQPPLKHHTGYIPCSSASLAASATPQQAHINVGVRIAAEPPDQQQPAKVQGVIATPGVITPGKFRDYWSQRIRPRLGALWGSMQRSSNAERVLLALDELLMQLRSSRSLAVHLQQQHEDAAWRAAAAQVAADCQKYERYILGSKTLANKLSLIEARLQCAMSSDRTATPSVQQHEQQPTSESAHQPGQLLQLCRVLLAIVKSQLPEDSQSWLAALESSDPNAVLLQQLKQQEQELVAAVDALVAQPVLLHLPRPLSELLPEEHFAAINSSAATQPANSSSTSSTSDPAETETAHVVLVTRGLLAELLQRCSDSSVRRQVYQQVLQPKLAQAAVLLDRLARSRQQQARLTGFDSYLDLTQQRMSVGGSGCAQHSSSNGLQPGPDRRVRDPGVSDQRVDFLLQLAAELQPLAQQEVAYITQQQQQKAKQPHQPAGAEAQTDLQQQGQQQEFEPLADESEQQQSSRGPWDWDFLLHKMQEQRTGVLRDSRLQQHLHLHGVVHGFSSLLQQVLGVQLVIRPAGQAEVWGQHVVPLMVVKQCSESCTQSTDQLQQPQQPAIHADPEQQSCAGAQASSQYELLGTIYLDVAGGYGCRMLRYTGAQSNSSTRAAAEGMAVWQKQAARAPAVAVGLSGSLLTTPDVEEQPGFSLQRQQDSCGGLLGQQDTARSLQGAALSAVNSSGDGGCCNGTVLSVSQLWEFGHEMGHALHLILSIRQPACHLTGRFAPPSLLEVPSQLMERLFTYPEVLAQVCQHHQTHQHLPAELAQALAAHYGCRYNSVLAVMARLAAGLAEQMYGQFGGDGEDYWRGAWQAVSGLPDVMASNGCLRELSLLPVLAAHQGTYHCYLTSWCVSAQLCDRIFEPLIHGQRTTAEQTVLQHKALAVFEGLNAVEWSNVLLGTLNLRSQEAGFTDTTTSVGLVAAESILYDRVLSAEALREGDMRRWVWKP